jgi:GAF domain-containing protein
VESDGPSRDPRSTLPAAITAVATAADLDAALRAILQAATESLGAISAAVLLADPDRPGLQLAATEGLDADAAAALADDAQDSGHPFTVVATTRAASFDREAMGSDGTTWLTSYVPLVSIVGGVETGLGALGMTWPAGHTLAEDDRDLLRALGSLAAIAVDRARLASAAAERSEWFERMAHTDPLTGIANERTVGRVLELELARAGRQGGEVSPSSTSTTSDPRTSATVVTSATTSCGGSRPCWPSRSAWSIRSGGSAVTSSCSWRLGPPGRWSLGASRRASQRCRSWPVGPCPCRPG